MALSNQGPLSEEKSLAIQGRVKAQPAPHLFMSEATKSSLQISPTYPTVHPANKDQTVATSSVSEHPDANEAHSKDGIRLNLQGEDGVESTEAADESAAQAALIFSHSTLSAVPLSQKDQVGGSQIGSQIANARTENNDIDMPDAKPSSQPTIDSSVSDSRPDVDVQMKDAERHVRTPESPTPLGSPIFSVADVSVKSKRPICSSSNNILSHRKETSGFPKFDDGDVLMVSPTGRVWKLHSATLKKASAHLHKLLEHDVKAARRRDKKEDLKLVRHKIYMEDWEENPQETRVRSFKLVKRNTKEQRASLTDPPYNRIYDNLFRCFYNLEPYFRPPVGGNIQNFLLDAISLLRAAEHIGAGHAVRLLIETHSMRLGERLWKHVAKNAAAWSDISLRLQSPIIFRAAMAHLVGRWDLWGPNGVDKQFLMMTPNGVLLTNFATRKAAELKEAKLQAERLMIEFYPQKLWHDEPAGNETYGADVHLWQALILVRQYFSSAMLANLHHCAADGGAYFYGCIGEGAGAAYLGDEAMEGFHACFHMTTEGKASLRQAIAWTKDEVKPIVAQLLVDQSYISRTKDDPKPNYLTCSVIDDDELPWICSAGAQYELDRD